MRALISFAKNTLGGNTAYKIAIAVVVFLLFEAWLRPAFSQVPVTINGRATLSASDSTVGQILAGSALPGQNGDLLDIDGRILDPGEGRAARVLLNGRPVSLSSEISINDRIEVIPALNRVEQIEIEVHDVVLADEVEGEGEYTIVREVGVVGKKLVARGRRSGKIVSVRNLLAARPFRIARTAQKPDKVIALTFDDGPTPPYTAQVARTLTELRATGTFFMVGSQAALFPESVRAIRAAGFQVANHSYSHGRLDFADEEAVIRELDATSDTITPLIGERMNWFRPPYGAVTDKLRVVAAQRGYHTLRWHIDSRDWEGPTPEAIAARVIKDARPGAVVLMHDGGGDRNNTVRALPIIISALYEQGYAFITLEQWAR